MEVKTKATVLWIPIQM